VTGPSFTGELLGFAAFWTAAALGTVVLLRLRARRHKPRLASVHHLPVSHCRVIQDRKAK
jgi:hypothetical protein